MEDDALHIPMKVEAVNVIMISDLPYVYLRAGIAFETKFAFACSGWISDASLTYEFNKVDSNGQRVLLFKAEGDQVRVQNQLLPPGDGQSGILQIAVTIRDSLGSTALYTFGVKVDIQFNA
jgi:hypothetical protein